MKYSVEQIHKILTDSECAMISLDFWLYHVKDDLDLDTITNRDFDMLLAYQNGWLAGITYTGRR